MIKVDLECKRLQNQLSLLSQGLPIIYPVNLSEKKKKKREQT